VAVESPRCAEEVRLDLAERARLRALLAMRKWWASRLYPATYAHGDPQPWSGPAASAFAQARAWANAMSLAQSVHARPQFCFFAWLEAAMQDELWRVLGEVVDSQVGPDAPDGSDQPTDP